MSDDMAAGGAPDGGAGGGDDRLFPELGGTSADQDRFFGLLILLLILAAGLFLTQCGPGALDAMQDRFTVVGDESEDASDVAPKPGDVAAVTTSVAASDATDDGAEADVAVFVGAPFAVVMAVDGDQVTLTGSVPDQDTMDALVDNAIAVVGVQNVDNQLAIDSDLTTDGGLVTVQGSTSDPAVLAGLNAAAGAPGVQVSEQASAPAAKSAVTTTAPAASSPFNAVVSVDGERWVLTGAVPDQDTMDGLVGQAEDAVGADNVDNQLTIDESLTAGGGTVTITGEVPSEQAAEALRPIADSVAAEAGAILDDRLIVVEVSADDVEEAVAADLNDLFVEAGDVLFATNSAAVTDEARPVLDDAVTLLSDNPDVRVLIVGHTDAQGDEARNLLLSQNRANAVRDYLFVSGIDRDRMETEGRGESEPVADNDTLEGQAKNRRIEFLPAS